MKRRIWKENLGFPTLNLTLILPAISLSTKEPYVGRIQREGDCVFQIIAIVFLVPQPLESGWALGAAGMPWASQG